MGAARMPPASVISMADAAKTIGMDKKECRNLVEELKRKRLPFLSRWKNIRDYQLPYIGELDDNSDENEQARRKDRHIYHGCAWESNQIFAAGIMSGLTPQSRQWFRLTFADKGLGEHDDASRLLDQRMDILNDVLNKSNFYNSIHSCYLELAFGQAPLGIFPSSKTGVHFVPLTIGTYMIESNADGMVDTMCREYYMTTRQLADKFGIDALPSNLKNEYENRTGKGERHKLFWLVKPNKAADKERIDRFHMPFVSAYWLEDSNESEWLYLGGFNEFPAPVGRFLITGNQAYGKGPGWFAEADSKGLQLLEKDYMTAIELSVKPPMQSDAETAKKGISLIPGKNTVLGGSVSDGVKPLFQVGVDLDHLQAKITELEDRIKRAYSADLFLMLDNLNDKSMTAHEVIVRNQEKLQQLGPVVQRMQFEFLSQIIERVYNILDRANIFPQPQDQTLAAALAQQEIKIEYISPLAQAQKLSGLVNIEQAIQFAAELAQFDQSIWDKMDLQATLTAYLDRLGAPAVITRSQEDFEKIQKEKAAQQQQQQQMQQAAMMAQAAAPAAQAAKNATDAANDGNPALAQLMGMGDTGQVIGK